MKFPVPGDVFEDAYRVDSILGSGGFARVYKATELGLERPVALKILRPPVRDYDDDAARENYLETLMKRFQREALLLSKLKSPYTVTMLHYGKTDDGLLYMVLELIDGVSLAEVSREGMPLEPGRVVRILSQVLESLHEAHTMGMLHRDLKPANIMIYEHLGEADHVKLLDFGIAKTVSDVGGAGKKDLTSDGTLIGTPRYMAPEQIQGEETGPPADIYALGLVAYELIVGERAITDDSSIQIIGQQMSPRSFILPDHVAVPLGLRNLVNRMIDKSLSRRYESAKQILDDLRAPDILDDTRKVEEPDETQREIPQSLLEDARQELLEEQAHPKSLDPSQQDLSWEIAPQRKSTAIALLGIGLVVLVLIGLVAINVSNGDSEAASNRISEEETTAGPALNDGTRDDLEPIFAQKDAGAKLKPVRISSNVDGVIIQLDGETLGNAPIDIPGERLPAMVVARWNKFEQEVEISPDSEAVTVKFVEHLAESEDPEAANDLEPKKSVPETTRVERQPSPKPRPRPKRAKPDPKPDPKPGNTYLPID